MGVKKAQNKSCRISCDLKLVRLKVFWSKILHGKIKFRYFVEKCPKGPNLRNMTVFGQMTVLGQITIFGQMAVFGQMTIFGQNSSSQKFNFSMKMNKFRRNFEKIFFGDRLIDLE